MISLTNYGSGEIQIADEAGHVVKLDRDAANRLVMMGRMHTVAEFIEKLPTLVPEPTLLDVLIKAFQNAATNTDKWNLKEKFARLQTLVKGYVPKDPNAVVEVVTL